MVWWCCSLDRFDSVLSSLHSLTASDLSDGEASGEFRTDSIGTTTTNTTMINTGTHTTATTIINISTHTTTTTI